ncbi:hypothetical protein EVAR_80601_1 [Eumeta japonica]|uniref:Uncharacterized protein n=1 Tax=Eumeta variegata TaxID=151549 RepID=A0A4C1TNT4_EUMVA|nr:hypothetical protein EVAR_80601_1 [Eumeta japonica]
MTVKINEDSKEAGETMGLLEKKVCLGPRLAAASAWARRQFVARRRLGASCHLLVELRKPYRTMDSITAPAENSCNTKT